MYYTYWTYQITTGYVVLAVYAFFLISLMLERYVQELHCWPKSIFSRSFIDQSAPSYVLLKLYPEFVTDALQSHH